MKTPREQTVERLALNLKKLEKSWIGQGIGIGFDADLETGKITIYIGPGGQTYRLTITVQADDVRIGGGEWN